MATIPKRPYLRKSEHFPPAPVIPLVLARAEALSATMNDHQALYVACEEIAGGTLLSDGLLPSLWERRKAGKR